MTCNLNQWEQDKALLERIAKTGKINPPHVKFIRCTSEDIPTIKERGASLADVYFNYKTGELFVVEMDKSLTALGVSLGKVEEEKIDLKSAEEGFGKIESKTEGMGIELPKMEFLDELLKEW